MGRWDFVRRFMFWLVVGVMLALEGLFLLAGCGVDLSFQFALWGVLVSFPILFATSAAVVGSRRPQPQPKSWPGWALLGCGLFTVWASLYFLMGRVPKLGPIHYLPAAVEAHIPPLAPFSFLYLLLYPIFLLPWFIVREKAVVQRLAMANIFMFVVCSTCFIVYPIAVQRPPLPIPTSLAEWVLGTIWGNDVAWNCMPSEHCMAAMIASLAVWETNRKASLFAFASTLLIGLSTLFTKQHYLVDVLAGYGLAVAAHQALKWSRAFAPSAVLERSADR
jgi:membrane-associated phospholipid phosphatase